MELSAIKQLIGQGQIEQALEQLLTQLEATPELGELAQIVRVNQADFYQTKSQVVRGTIAADDARLANNQVTDNLLQVIRRLEKGKTTLLDDGPLPPPNSRQAWRYYFAGGVVALAVALLAWQFLWRKSGDCPEYGSSKTQRIMILPFLRTGTATAKREADLLDELDGFLGKDARLKPIAEVNENSVYDINANYPNPSEAAELASHCGVEMVVWGKMRNSNDTVEVRYKLINPTARTVSNTQDTTLNRLLSPGGDGVFVGDVKWVARLLYLVMANQEGSSLIAANALGEIESAMPQPLNKTTATGSNGAATDPGLATLPLDTSLMLTAAATHQRLGQTQKAIELYDQILVAYPTNKTALRLRGSLSYQKKDYATAAHDFEALSPEPTKASNDVLQKRADSYLKSGQPDRAKQDLEHLRKKGTTDDKWLKMKQKEVADSTTALRERSVTMERLARAQPKNTKAQLNVARAQLGLGDRAKAISTAKQLLQTQPKNTQALEVVVDAYVQQGDTTRAEQAVRQAIRAGADVKSVKWIPTTVMPLNDGQQPRKQ